MKGRVTLVIVRKTRVPSLKMRGCGRVHLYSIKTSHTKKFSAEVTVRLRPDLCRFLMYGAIVSIAIPYRKIVLQCSIVRMCTCTIKYSTLIYTVQREVFPDFNVVILQISYFSKTVVVS
jgi:hypothetical protein